MSALNCKESLYGIHDAARDGKCHWCGRRVDSPCPKPTSFGHSKAEIDTAYEYYYDPDFGSDRMDKY